MKTNGMAAGDGYDDALDLFDWYAGGREGKPDMIT